MMSGTRVRVEEKVIGPEYDPYGWTAIVVQRRNVNYMFRSCGLRGDSVEVEGCDLIVNCFDNEAGDMFKQLTGAHPNQWHQWHNKLHYSEKDDTMVKYW